MIKVENLSIVGSSNKPVLIDITFNDKQPKAPLIIFIHGFKGFKDWGAHHLIARYFAQNGYRYLKFNLSHSGVKPEQPNDVSDMEAFAVNTFSKELLDVDMVINYALQNLDVNDVYLIGHSRGGGLAILQAVNNPKVKALITWSAIADFSSLWGNVREAEWRKEGKIYVMNARTKEKMPLNVTLLEDFEANKEKLNILNAAKQINIPWLIVQGNEDVNVPFETAQKLADANASSKLIKIEGANHVYGASHPYTSESMPLQLLQVCEKSLAFLKSSTAYL
jgi:pimeloyl-ACP methyl ester carboxylesterase